MAFTQLSGNKGTEVANSNTQLILLVSSRYNGYSTNLTGLEVIFQAHYLVPDKSIKSQKHLLQTQVRTWFCQLDLCYNA